ncbi:hypothetical protein [Listeria valentina]|uniref:hypothetical protein n=1 Tax=Listeria valentina TaxID=2705293 RepID=UPI00142FEC6D|nr:hypothetical protein [Listeria valentina]
MRNGREALEATKEDFEQLDRLFFELQNLLAAADEFGKFEVLVQIERKLDEYRLQQSLSGQFSETRCAAELESL